MGAKYLLLRDEYSYQSILINSNIKLMTITKWHGDILSLAWANKREGVHPLSSMGQHKREGTMISSFR